MEKALIKPVYPPPKEITVRIDGEEFELTRGKLIPGSKPRNDPRNMGLSDIKWYVYKFDDKALEYFGGEYDGVAAMHTRITEQVLKQVKNNRIIIKEGITTASRANVDFKTGNIHPRKLYVKNSGYNSIRQLVLFNGNGPLTLDIFDTGDCYAYGMVHKACYYPTINDNDMSKYEDDKRHIFLKAVWKALGLKEIR